MIHMHILWRLARCRTVTERFGEDCWVWPLVKSLISCFCTSSSAKGPQGPSWIRRCFLHCLKQCDLFLFAGFYPRSTKTKQLSWSRKYKEDKPLLLLSWDKFAKINLNCTVKNTAPLQRELAYPAFLVFSRRAALPQQLPGAPNIAAKLWFFSSQAESLMFLTNAKSPGSSYGAFSLGADMINTIVIADGCLVSLQCVWINELSN